MSSPKFAEFVPSSVRAMSLKVSKSFAQHVNLKIEPTIYSDWCKKPNSKKKSESSQIRFCVITPAAFYVCKLRHISTIKISQIFPWISIKSFKSNLTTHEVFLEFADDSIQLIFTNVNQFVTRALSYLKSILPPYFPVEYSITPELDSEIESTRPKLSQVADLFISKCKALKENVDPNFILNLKHTVKSKKTFIIDGSQLNELKVDAMCSAILNFPYIRKVKFGGKNFDRLYQKASIIISKNDAIKKIEIFKYRSDHKFIEFINKLKTCHIISLVFTEVSFTLEMSTILIKGLSSMNLEKLTFSGCQFNKFILPEFDNDLNCSITKLTIQNDTFNPKEIRHFFLICLSTNITNLVLTDSNIDIKLFFDLLKPNKSAFKVTKLDLSGNLCSSNYTDMVSIPERIKTLILQRITWEKDSLLTFLSKQVFLDEIELDLTRAYLVNDQVSNILAHFPEMPPSTNVIKFTWNSNPFFIKLLNYLSNCTKLQYLNLDNCIIPIVDKKIDRFNEKKHILQSLSKLISSLHLKKLSIKSTMRDFSTNFMITLKDALSENQTLTGLNIDDNAIGEEGLLILKDILTSNPRIKSLSFDGCEVRNYQSLISFLNFLSQLPYTKQISRPQIEITRFAESNGKKISREIKTAWEAIDGNSSASNRKFYDESSSCRSSNSLLSSNLISISTIDLNEPCIPMTHLSVEWESGFDIPYDNSVNEWSTLKQKYSYSNITGIDFLDHSNENSKVDFFSS